MLLSICIPTFNRAHTLRPLLAAIKDEIFELKNNDRVEIVISDNCSEDDTETIVKSFILTGLIINYYKQSTNVGFGNNLTRAIYLANGRHCWMMGSDDIPIKGAIGKVLKEISSGADIILGAVLTNKVVRPLLNNIENEVKLTNLIDLKNFLNNCTEISSLFAFISSIIIRKEFWDQTKIPENLVSHPYTHLLRIFTGLSENNIILRYVASPIVVTGIEENEWNAQVFKHFELDFYTLIYLADNIFDGEKEIRAIFGRIFKKQYGSTKVLCARSNCDQATWI